MTQAEQLIKDIAFCIDECGMNNEAVSYTHLRANETPENLVIRLNL